MGLDTDFPQLIDAVLRRLGLQFARGPDIGDERQVDVEHVVAADIVRNLADRLQEGQAFDIADSPPDFANDDVGIVRHCPDVVLDLIGDVRHDLNGAAQIIPAPFLHNHVVIDAAGREVIPPSHRDSREALIMAEVEIGLGPVFGHIDLPMLIRVHGTRVHINIRIQLQKGNASPPAF